MRFMEGLLEEAGWSTANTNNTQAQFNHITDTEFINKVLNRLKVVAVSMGEDKKLVEVS